MITETFAMIGEHDNQSLAIVPGGAQCVQHPSNLGIGKRDLPVVGPAGEPIGKRRRRIVGCVRIVEMQPGKEWRAARSAVGCEPGDGGISDLVRTPLRALIDRAGLVEFLVELVETLAEPEGGRNRVRAHERGGAIPARFQSRGQCRMARAEREHNVAAHAVRRRIVAGENRRMRRRRERRRRLHLIEAHAAGRERVDHGRRAARSAVGADVIGAQRIDGDEQQVQPRGAPLGEDPPSGRRRCQHQQGDYRRGAETARAGPRCRTGCATCRSLFSRRHGTRTIVLRGNCCRSAVQSADARPGSARHRRTRRFAPSVARHNDVVLQ